eukprot:m51a1_g2090 hypothetical protein (389) ;mRNA; f:1523417-1524782
MATCRRACDPRAQTPIAGPHGASVLVIYTGGTIGMKKEGGSYQELGKLAEQYRADLPVFEVLALRPLLDSTEMSQDNWATIACTIRDNYERGPDPARHPGEGVEEGRQWDGFLVLHGTDTLAYTASALAFALGGIRKTVVITGSQIPWCEVRTDARSNVIDSLLIAAKSQIPEVVVFFDRKLMRGCRTTKTNSWGISAFSSDNYPLLGEAGVSLVKFDENTLPAPEGGPDFQTAFSKDVILQPVYPACEDMVAGFLEKAVSESHVRGIVLEAYGCGNVQVVNNEALIKKITELSLHRGVVIVVVSRCPAGNVSLGTYEGGSKLVKAKCVSGHDMTTEAAFAKLCWLLAQDRTAQDVDLLREQMETSLRGELDSEFTALYQGKQTVIFP